MKKYYNFLFGLIPLVFAPFIISCSNSNNTSGNPPEIVNNYGGKYQIKQESSNSTKTVMSFYKSSSKELTSLNNLKSEISAKNSSAWTEEYATKNTWLGEISYTQYTLLNYKELENFKLFTMNYGSYKDDNSSLSDPVYLNLADVNFESILNDSIISNVIIEVDDGEPSYGDYKHVTVYMNFDLKDGYKWENSNLDYKLTFRTVFDKPKYFR
ncbi:MAG: hypothetical protein K2H56_03180 [Malacoplasma sp.]|nr:hypothetical protein [Malacoplasma sp.]